MRLIALLVLLPLLAEMTFAQTTKEGIQREFVITNFQTESGATLPKARVIYGTYGQLN